MLAGLISFLIIEMLSRGDETPPAADTCDHDTTATGGDAAAAAVETDSRSISRTGRAEGDIAISGYLNLFANVVDNFTHGLAIGGSYKSSVRLGHLTTLAIMLHEVPHEISDFAILLSAGFDRWGAAKAQILTASGSLLGMLVGFYGESNYGAN